MRVLFVANIAKHIIRFHLPYLKWFQENGYETHVAAFGDDAIPYCDVQYNLPIVRSPFSASNIKAYRQLKDIIAKNDFTIIHGHTPMGGFLARVCSVSARKNGTKVFYTAHGFHFYKGAPLKNWLIYYPVEKFLANLTDAIITINHEDYDALTKFKFNCNYKFIIPGIGINVDKLKCTSEFNKSEFRLKNQLNENDFILIYLAEYVKGKNHMFIVEASKLLVQHIPELKILFAGRGILQNSVEEAITKNKLEKVIKILGFRTDIGDLISISDIGISSSVREGFGLNLAEEMFCGIPVVATINRGHKEIVTDKFNGLLFKQNDIEDFVNSIIRLYENRALRFEYSKNAIESVQKFRIDNSLSEMTNIYNIVLNDYVQKVD